ncbi:MAG: 3-hydroxyacyl-CoA dehydrogenase/enoyl-CoA hydratase family protein, partial [Gammaproteobacteria bacterium]
MSTPFKLYPTAMNPLLVKTSRALPKEIGIIGAGTIGPDIAYYLKSEMPEIKLFLIDISEKALQKAEQRLIAYTEKAVAKRKMSTQLAEQVLENLFYTTDYAQLKNCDLVIEAATESIPLKKQIFASIEQIVGSETIITSNTSSIPATRLFSDMNNPERATVTHFFAPAWRSLTVEIIDW